MVFTTSLEMLQDPPKLKAQSLLHAPFCSGEETMIEEKFITHPMPQCELVMYQDLDQCPNTISVHFLLHTFLLCPGCRIRARVICFGEDCGSSSKKYNRFGIIGLLYLDISPLFVGHILPWDQFLLFDISGIC